MSTKQDRNAAGPRRRTERRPSENATAKTIRTGTYDTQWGTGTVAVSGGRLIGVSLPESERGAVAPSVGLPALLAADVAERQREVEQERTEATDADVAAIERWTAELEAYFRGERLVWRTEDITLNDMALGPFERSVYETLLTIPPAVTVSYGVLAEMAGYPRAARAVGNAMAANPIPVVIPCHRVVRADGTLGNYGNDPAWKQRLLLHERTHVSADLPETAAAKRDT